MNRIFAVFALALTLLLSGGCSLIASSASDQLTAEEELERELNASGLGAEDAENTLKQRRAKGMQAYQERDYFTALGALYPLAQEGDPQAQRQVGIMFANGQGVPADGEAAARWLERAARQEDIDAQRLLGRMLSQGRYLARDTEQARRWLERAAANGDPNAQFYLASLYQTSEMQGSRQAAFEWMKAAAEQGHLAAQGNLGWMYLQGEGVEADQDAALYWLEEAAGRGLAMAQFNLSLLYERMAVQQEADAWLRKAAANGSEAARVRLLRQQTQDLAASTSLVLFGVPFMQAERSLMRERIEEAGGIALQPRDDEWVDRYEASRLIEGADRLFASYSLRDSQLAELRYRFPQQNTPAGVSVLATMLTAKYGAPEDNQPPYEVSGVHHVWIVEGVNIELGRNWPDDALYLRFFVPERLNTLEAEQAGNAGDTDIQPRLETY